MSKKNIGFTLAELLVVVAIIAVLTAIAIPVFTGQLEKSREAVDLANVRSAYAEVMTAAITEDTASPLRQSDGSYLASVTLTQAKDGWTTKTDDLTVGGIAFADDKHWLKAPKAKGTCKAYFQDGEVYIDWGGGQKKPPSPERGHPLRQQRSSSVPDQRDTDQHFGRHIPVQRHQFKRTC